jgi:hypothetical protein
MNFGCTTQQRDTVLAVWRCMALCHSPDSEWYVEFIASQLTWAFFPPIKQATQVEDGKVT